MYPLCVRTWFSVHESFASSLKKLRGGWKILPPPKKTGPTKCATLSLLVKDWSLVHPWGDTKRQTLSTIRRVCTSAAAPLPPEKCNAIVWVTMRWRVLSKAPTKKNTEHWDRSFVGRRFFEDGGTFFCVKTCPFNEPSLPTNWWRISTPTSKFFVIKIISNAFCRQTIPLGSLRAIKLETATAGARWPPWGFWWLSAWCFSCQFLINNPFPRGCLGEQKRKR